MESNLLLGNHLKALLNEDSKVDEDLISGASHFIVFEEDVCSELRDSFVNHIITISLCFRCWAYSLKV